MENFIRFCRMSSAIGQAVSQQPGLQQASSKEEEMENEAYETSANIFKTIGVVGDAISVMNGKSLQQQQNVYQQPGNNQSQSDPSKWIQAAQTLREAGTWMTNIDDTSKPLPPISDEFATVCQTTAATGLQFAKCLLERHEEQRNEEKKKNIPSNPNLEFYQNKICSAPNGAKIEVILTDWNGNYDKLTQHSGFMQWLFPTPEQGTNSKAFRLTKIEANAIKADVVLKERVKRAFKMILDLYGMTFNDDNIFSLKSDDPNCLKHFISHKASRMNVTRMLHALNELGYEELGASWLIFLGELIFGLELLPEDFKSSFNDYWM